MRRVPKDLLERYLFNGQKTQLYGRVLDAIRPRENADRMLNAMVSDRFVPAGNTLVAGVQPLSPNCAVIGAVTPEKHQEQKALFVRLLTAAIGCGIDLSAMEDPVAVLRDWSSAACAVRLRWNRPLRGNMATLRIDHPRILEFISCKSVTNSDLSIFNISVTVPDSFMHSLRASGHNTNLFDRLCQEAHRTGDPGIIFIDRVQQTAYSAVEGRICTSVPCGEQFMFAGETCNLGSINLDAMLREQTNRFDYDLYIDTIRLAVQFLDHTVDHLVVPDEWMQEKTRSLRRIGLGVMGLATLLQSMGIAYESEDALNFSETLANILTDTAVTESKRLGALYGYHRHSQTRRNISVTCLPPTGGIRRLVADDGFSVEPLFTDATSITPLFAVRMATAWQRHIENGVSKTVNLNRRATVSDVASVFKACYDGGGKSITVYRDGCHSRQPMRCHTDHCTVE